MQSESSPHSVETEILGALDLPSEAVPVLLEHVAAFCQAHGGSQHYQELLELVERLRNAL